MASEQRTSKCLLFGSPVHKTFNSNTLIFNDSHLKHNKRVAVLRCTTQKVVSGVVSGKNYLCKTKTSTHNSFRDFLCVKCFMNNFKSWKCKFIQLHVNSNSKPLLSLRCFEQIIYFSLVPRLDIQDLIKNDNTCQLGV